MTSFQSPRIESRPESSHMSLYTYDWILSCTQIVGNLKYLWGVCRCPARPAQRKAITENAWHNEMRGMLVGHSVGLPALGGKI